MKSTPPTFSERPSWCSMTERRPRVVLMGAGDRPNVIPEVERLRPLIAAHAEIVAVDMHAQLDLATLIMDFAVVFGGDGSILRSASRLRHHSVPVLGVNLGRLGFLADLTTEEFTRVWGDICQGNCRIVEHLMLQCVVWRGSTAIAEQVGLNEVSVLAGQPFSMIDIELYVDAVLATSYSCDGLIISTPVGSTAHSLSAGGPILRKNLHAFVISPISPHTLTVRPVVDSSDHVFEMVVRKPNEGTSVVMDGNVLCRLQADDRVRVERAPQSFQLIEAPGHNYYRTLREKLGWSGNIRQS